MGEGGIWGVIVPGNGRGQGIGVGGGRGWGGGGGGAAPHTYAGGAVNGQRRNKADGIRVKEQPQSPSENQQRKAGGLQGARGAAFIQLAGLSD